LKHWITARIIFAATAAIKTENMFKVEIIGRLLIQHNLSEYEAILLLSEEFIEEEKELERLQLIADLKDGFFITNEEAITMIDEENEDEEKFSLNGVEYVFKYPFKPVKFSAS
jgi:hypothetical protein